MRHWTLEERLRQSQLIQQWKPWRLAGVKTPEGKAISKMNAYKHGGRSAEVRDTLKAIAQYRKNLKRMALK